METKKFSFGQKSPMMASEELYFVEEKENREV
jgi:hypothetical protein